MIFHSGAHGIFEKFQHDVVQMSWDIGKCHIQPSRYDNLRSISILPRTHERRIINRPLHNLVRTRLTTYNPNIILHRRLSQTQILPYQNAYPNPRNVKPVQKRVRRLHQLELNGIPPHLYFFIGHGLLPLALAPVVVSPQQRTFSYRRAEFERPPRHLDEHAAVSLVHVLQYLGEFAFPFLLPLARRRVFVHAQHLHEGRGVQFLHLLDRSHILQERHAG
mmetsp:Transcript_36805/g.79443  ORF Transcript_36805/g.79443 Transcript_36805/m.79443 type:complete len:220 (+) Transcript_36805:588-1247(+)